MNKSALFADLTAAGDLVVDPEIIESYRRDQAAPGIVEAGLPLAVTRPRTTEQVATAVRAAARHGVPIAPRGAGSGLSGGANAIDGGLVVCLERMTDVIDIDASSLIATVQAGVINSTLGAAAGEHRLWYAPDPSSWEFSTIGGNVATNAGGLCCVKYGVTRDSLLGAEVVLGDGRIVRLGRRTRKGVAGYDLTALLCGSEGTLGIITEVTVQLRPMPGPSSTLAASFPTLPAAGDAIAQIVRGSCPSLLELVDASTIAAVEAFQPMDLDLDAAALLFARADEAGGVEAIAWMERICRAAGASLVVTSDEEAEARMLLAARRLAYPALEHQGTTLLDDVAVPVGAVPALVAGIEEIALRFDVRIATFGHAGDGNMHPTIVYDHHDASTTQRVRGAFAAIVALALSLGGTTTGEHGVGRLKQPFVADEIGDDVAELSRSIKRAWDPAGIMNPGKKIAPVG